MPREVEPTGRRAFFCTNRNCVPPYRIFLPQGETRPPRCPEHGASMERQQNRPPGRPRADR